jgi:hypothetical protein
LSFVNHVIHAIHVEFLDVNDDEGITNLCAALSGFAWFPNCREAFLVVAQGTLLLRSFGTVAGQLGIHFATVPISLRLLLFETGWKAGKFHLDGISRWSKFTVHCASSWSVWKKKRETIVLKGEVKVMMIIVSSGSLELILEQKANNHVGSRGIDCCWMPHVRASRQCELAMQATRAC